MGRHADRGRPAQPTGAHGSATSPPPSPPAALAGRDVVVLAVVAAVAVAGVVLWSGGAWWAALAIAAGTAVVVVTAALVTRPRARRTGPEATGGTREADGPPRTRGPQGSGPPPPDAVQ